MQVEGESGCVLICPQAQVDASLDYFVVASATAATGIDDVPNIHTESGDTRRDCADLATRGEVFERVFFVVPVVPTLEFGEAHQAVSIASILDAVIVHQVQVRGLGERCRGSEGSHRCDKEEESTRTATGVYLPESREARRHQPGDHRVFEDELLGVNVDKLTIIAQRVFQCTRECGS